ncbi:unnamed protein product (macronuclear) [Paramecium tetraurelia]|uniref:Uncharacterized protein n=1 Tax=Paramecium tetraurelia TaxID=5888 RepID=A0DQ25_PARTE|nr:uncharacterized protein GSPATT00002542001 [Paramecium tetraurelia]CAK85142.1 unnamed protein product [Paramecium tetraurelia]|eukprot:XP_001452539.1 hypothetical protein (macronuclear) [Paramecium tetraurelia strain d4-2]
MDQQSLKQILSSSNTYSGTKKYLEAIQQQQKDIIQMCSAVVISILQDQQGSHLSKFYSLKFINELLELQEYDWIDMTQKKILPILEEYAEFKKESQDDERGKYIFIQNTSQKKKYEQVKELEYAGSIFFRYLLESIWVWSKWFPLDTVAGKLSLFKIAQERLSLQKVKFPQITYFNKNQVINHMQIQRPPKEMLEECRLLIKEHLEENSNSDLQSFQKTLRKIYFTDKKHQLQSLKSYPQVWKETVDLMRQGKMGQDVQIKLRTAQVSIMQKKFFQATQNLKKSKVALQQQVFNFSTVLSEKEKLLTEINNHILEKDLLKNQISQLQKQNDENLKENEDLRMQLSQLKLKFDTTEVQQEAPTLSNTFNDQFQRSKDLERQLQKKDIEIKRLSEQVQHYKGFISQMNGNLDQLQKLQEQTEMERFQLHQENLKSNLKQEELQNQIGLLKQSNNRLNEIIKQLQTQNNQQYEEYLQNLEKNSIYIQKLISDQSESPNLKQKQTEQIKELEHQIQRQRQEIENLKQQLDDNQKSGMQYNNQTKQCMIFNKTRILQPKK